MGTDGDRPAERLLRRALLPVCVLAGAVVVSGFFFPQFVGNAVTGTGWLVVALAFFGAGLAYLALLPVGGQVDAADAAEGSQRRTAPLWLRLRHHGLRGVLGPFLQRQNPVTFGVPVVGLAGFLLVRWLAPGATMDVVDGAQRVLLRDLHWLFFGAVLVAVGYALFLLVGPWGDVRLGGEAAEPTYTYPTYAALVFTAGIAAGIVFWGPAESLFHYRTPPPGVGAAPASSGAVVPALSYTLFHWGVSAWAAYLAVGLPIAYFVHQRGAPLRVSTILAPFLGVDGLDSRWATLVDVLAVFATIGGVGTSVGLVSQQFLVGIDYQWDVTAGVAGPLVFAAGLTGIYVVVAESGVHRGVRRIAGVTVVLFALVTALVLAVGPRGFVVDRGAAALGRYAVDFLPMSLAGASEWTAAWTGYYWSWWFSWAPFAGLFLAALSKGRRVRTVVLTAVGATSAATVVWFLVVGGTALQLQESGAADILGTMAGAETPEAVAGFAAFGALPLGELLMFLFLALILVFITSSAAVSTLVVAVLGTRRDVAPSTGTIVFWGVFQGGVAVAALLVGGAESLQTMAVLTGGPFAVLSLVALAGLTLTLARHEKGHASLPGRARDHLADRDITLLPERPDIRDDPDKQE